MLGRLDSLESYLGFRLSEKRDVGKFKRTLRSSSFNNWKALFLDSDISFFRKELGDIAEDMGYDDWSIDNKIKLDPSSGSDYVRKLVKEASWKRKVRTLIKK